MPADRLLDALAGGVRVFDLGRPLFVGMPQSPNHPEFRLALVRRHGDMTRPDGSSAANEIIVTGGHVGTHIDALSHVSHQGRLHGGLDAGAAQVGGRFSALGVDTVEPMVCRGVLLDIPAALGLDGCEPAYQVTPADLDAAVRHGGAEPRPGDVILLRTGWGRRWDTGTEYVGHTTGVPGPAADGARWLAERAPRAVGADTIAFEWLPAGAGHRLLPAHRILLVEHGIHIIETLALEELAAAGVSEFVFVLAPLKLVGATGSPVRPLALVGPTETGDGTG
ncbi:MAG TPA: cyclase family protein [Mycobacteriales bacterium]|nr:cyclase family protein [Mycobacteriales bacterium]